MGHGVFKIKSFLRVAPFTLRVKFDDSTEQTIDFSGVLKGELFGPLCDEKMFNGVRIDPETYTLVWPNGADFDPASLHDWPNVKKHFVAATNRWRPTKIKRHFLSKPQKKVKPKNHPVGEF